MTASGVSPEVVADLKRRLSALRHGTAERGPAAQLHACDVCGRPTGDRRLCPDCRHRLGATAAAAGPAPDLGFQALVQILPAAVFLAGSAPERPVRMAAEPLAALTGHPVDDFLSGRRTLASLAHPDDREPVLAAVASALRAGRAWSLEYRILHGQGGVRWVHEHARPQGLGAAAVVAGLLTDAEGRRRERTGLAELALRDPLTGLANRRAMEVRLRELCDRAEPLGIAVLDIDHFKQVNDVHGHQAGDRVLEGMGRRLREHAREDDTIARYGGEEFVWLMPGADLADAAGAAGRVRQAVAAEPLGGVPVRVSAGVAERRPAEEPDGLFARADQALYRAKTGGRDRVEIAG